MRVDTKKAIKRGLVWALVVCGLGTFLFSFLYSFDRSLKVKEAGEQNKKTTASDQPSQPRQQVEANRVYNTRAAVVGLPPGQRFMYVIPKDEATKIGGAKPDRNIYVTYETQSGEFGLVLTTPRLIRFLQPGNTPGSWDEVLYIQER